MKITLENIPTTRIPLEGFRIYHSDLGTGDVILCVPHALLDALKRGQEPEIQMDESASLDRFNHAMNRILALLGWWFCVSYSDTVTL